MSTPQPPHGPQQPPAGGFAPPPQPWGGAQGHSRQAPLQGHSHPGRPYSGSDHRGTGQQVTPAEPPEAGPLLLLAAVWAAIAGLRESYTPVYTIVSYWIDYGDSEYHRSVPAEIFNHFQSLLLLASGVALTTLSFFLFKRSRKALFPATVGIIVLVLSCVIQMGEMVFLWYSNSNIVLLKTLAGQLLNGTLLCLVPTLLVFVPGARKALRGAEPPPPTAQAVPFDRSRS